MDSVFSFVRKKLDNFQSQVAQNLATPRTPTRIQQGLAQPVTNYFNPMQSGTRGFWGTPIARGLANAQQFIESPKPIQIPEFKPFNQKTIPGQVGNFGVNAAAQIASVPFTTALNIGSDLGRFVGGNLATGRQALTYDTAKTAPARLAYNVADKNKNPNELLGNIAGTGADILAMGLPTAGGRVARFAQQGAGRGFAKTVLQQAHNAGKIGAIYSGLLALSEGRKLPIEDQALDTVKGAGTGYVGGAILGAGIGSFGYLLGSIKNAIHKIKPELNPEQIDRATKSYLRNELGQFTRDKKQFYSLQNDPYLKPSDVKRLRAELGLPDKYDSADIPLGLSVKNIRGGQPKPPSQSGVENLEGLMSGARKQGIKLDVVEDDFNKVYLKNINIPKDKQSQGMGTKILQDLTDYADSNGKEIVLQPAVGFGTKERLVNFFQKHGFISDESGGLMRRPSLSQEVGKSILNTESNAISNIKLSQKGQTIQSQDRTPLRSPQQQISPQDDFISSLENDLKSLSSRAGQSPKNSKLPQLSTGGTGGIKPPRKGSLSPDQQMNPSVAGSLRDSISSVNYDVKRKVNLLDYLKTPESVLNKIGLGREATKIRQSTDAYQKSLKSEIERIISWEKRAPGAESSAKIFKWLDGDKTVRLNPNELKVGKEIRQYLANWARALNLPKDKRIAEYITHVFDFDVVKKEFDPDIARIIQDRVPASVYNPFLEKRLGKLGYVEDVWRALDAYTKRATRKFHMDPALRDLSVAADGLEPTTHNYIKKYAENINMRPTELENLIDNLIKSSPIGYKLGQRPTINIATKERQAVFRGALGLNLSSALRNLSQGANTYAKLGEKHTVLGYAKLVKNMAANNMDELYDEGILNDNIVQDRTISATKQALSKLDKGLFKFFDTAEKINRGAAYFGAKSKAISQGLSEREAIDFAKKIVRETQFLYGPIDNPVLLNDTIVKSFAQFLTYPIKQTEFLANMVKNKEVGGIIRYALSAFVFTSTIGKMFGMKPTEFIPFYDAFTQQRFSTPALQLGATLADTPNLLSEDENRRDRAADNWKKSVALTFPAGVQIKKTIEGLQATNRGYGQSKSGRVRYLLPQDGVAKLKGALFGQYAFPEAQNYFDQQKKGDAQPLGDKQSAFLKSLPRVERLNFFNQAKEATSRKREENEIKDSVSEGGTVKSGDKIFYNDGGIVRTIDLSKYKNTPSDPIQKAKWEQKRSSEASQIYFSPLSDKDKKQAISKMGLDYAQVEFKALDSIPNEYKAPVISKILDQRNWEVSKVNKFIDEGILTSPLVDKMYQNGSLDEGKAVYLKDYIKKYNSGKKPGGGGRKPKKISVGKVNAVKPSRIKIPKGKLPKVKAFPKGKKFKASKPKKVKIPQPLKFPKLPKLKSLEG